jgi:hypothetical protein
MRLYLANAAFRILFVLILIKAQRERLRSSQAARGAVSDDPRADPIR